VQLPTSPRPLPLGQKFRLRLRQTIPPLRVGVAGLWFMLFPGTDWSRPMRWRCGRSVSAMMICWAIALACGRSPPAPFPCSGMLASYPIPSIWKGLQVQSGSAAADHACRPCYMLALIWIQFDNARTFPALARLAGALALDKYWVTDDDRPMASRPLIHPRDAVLGAPPTPWFPRSRGPAESRWVPHFSFG